MAAGKATARGRRRRRGAAKLALSVAAALLLLAMAGTAGGYVWLRSSLPDYDGVQTVPGIQDDVTIVRDGAAIPHVFANSESDAWFAVGFVHAQDRLWQLDLFRRAGQGRLAEVLGREALPFDRWARGLGLRELGAAAWPKLPAETQAALRAYAAGINAFLETRAGALPPEFVLLGYAPEPWRPEDSVTLGKLMAFQLSHNFRLELLRAALEERLGPKAGELLPPLGLPPATRLAMGEAARLALAIPQGLSGVGASNAWAVAGSRTSTGAPLLAHDPHNPLGAPNLWYLVRIDTPTLTLAGSTAPGIPFIVFGQNGAIAWGMTSAGSDLQDLFIERPDPADPTRYLTETGTLPFRIREETIAVAGDDPATLRIRSTRHGPVISDIEPGGASDALLTLADVDLVPEDSSLAALAAINHARGWSDFLAAARLWRAPAQNLVYADRAGNIGRVAPARVPIRPPGADGRRPAPGWSGSHEWRGTIAFEERPRALNPPTGTIVSANDWLQGSDHPHFLGDPLDEPFRGQRIAELLGGGSATPDSMAAIQQDLLAGDARILLPLLLEMPPVEETAAALDLLRNWDMRMDRNRPEPLIYAAWLRELTRTLFADDLGELFTRYWAIRPATLAQVLTQNNEWCDDRTTAERTESCKDALSSSLRLALADLEQQQGGDPQRWRWGGAHTAYFRHPIWSSSPVLAWLFGASRVETGGGDFTVDVGTSDLVDPETAFAHVRGADYRAVYDISDLAASRFMIAFGQSGNPLSAHYGDLAEDWRDGRYVTLSGSEAEVAERGLGTLRLIPAP